MSSVELNVWLKHCPQLKEVGFKFFNEGTLEFLSSFIEFKDKEWGPKEYIQHSMYQVCCNGLSLNFQVHNVDRYKLEITDFSFLSYRYPASCSLFEYYENKCLLSKTKLSKCIEYIEYKYQTANGLAISNNWEEEAFGNEGYLNFHLLPVTLKLVEQMPLNIRIYYLTKWEENCKFGHSNLSISKKEYINLKSIYTPEVRNLAEDISKDLSVNKPANEVIDKVNLLHSICSSWDVSKD